MDQEITSLEQLLDKIKEAAENNEQVTLDNILDKVGRRSFAPPILIAGIITLAPLIGDIPGVPTIMGLLVMFTAGQLVFGKDHFWLPDWMLDRSVEKEKVIKGMDWIKKPARYFDRISHKRWPVLTNGTGSYIIAISCFLIAMLMPVMEFIPFSANGAGLALTTFGLALISQDGIIASIALFITATTFGVIIYNLL